MPRPLVIDSGAAETVIPSEWFTDYEIKENEDSRNGQFYVTTQRYPTKEGERTLT